MKGPKSYEDLRTVNGELLSSFQEACQKLGLMEDDTEVQQALQEACSVRFGNQLISFFGSLLEFCKPGNPLALWERFKQDLSRKSELFGLEKLSYIRFDIISIPTKQETLHQKK